MATCAGCGKSIDGEYIRALDRPWHTQCFKCAACGRLIGKETFFEQRGKAYHSACYHERFSPRCAGCGRPIAGQYVTALDKTWHPEHFVCAACKKPFAGRSFFERDGKAYCERDYHDLFTPRCAGCGKPAAGQYVTALGQVWHPEHFLCAACKKPFAGRSFFERDGKAYCERDYHDLFSPRCSVCGEPMRGTYLTNAWGESYCKDHQAAMSTCFSCGRLICERLTKGGVRYQDGRAMCNICRRTAIDDAEAGQRVMDEVRHTMAGCGLDLARVRPPLRLADQKEINRLSSRSYAKQPTGVVCSHVTTRNGEVISRQVDEIVILHGLPREHMAAVAAHELGHAWLFLNGFPELPPVVEEGICELCKYLWLRQRLTRESEYYLKSMDSADDPIYGQGFHKAHRALSRYSFPDLLAYVRQHRKLP